MREKEPFREATTIPPGMVKSAGFKDDPRYSGGHLGKPDITKEIVLKPNLVMIIPRIILWAVVYFFFTGESGPGASGSKWFLYGLVIIDIICAVPKFFFERTILKPDGIERTLLLHSKFFKWDDFHTLKRDFLGLTFRSKPGWGIWRDEFNLIFSWLYYSPASLRRVADLFPDELGHSPGHNHFPDNGDLMDIKA